MPFSSAAEIMRKAVVELADSYGGSIRARVSFFLVMMFWSSVPDGIYVFLDQCVNQKPYVCRLHCLVQVRRGVDAAFGKREIVRDYSHPLLQELGDRSSYGRAASGKNAVLDEKDGDDISA